MAEGAPQRHRGWAWLLATVATAAAGAGVPSPPVDCTHTPHVPWRTIAPHTWVWDGANADVSPSNGGHVSPQVLIGRGSSATLLDPGPSRQHGLAVRDSARCQLQRRIGRVLNSHAHAENVLGNAAFIGTNGSPPLPQASPTTALHMTERCPRCLAALQDTLGPDTMAGTAIVLPQPRLRDGQTLASDAGDWRLRVFEPAHSESDLALWNPRHRVLVAPSLVYWQRLPELAQGQAMDWMAALADLHRLRARVVVGSGAPDGGTQGLRATHAYLCQLTQRVAQGLERGQTALDANHADLPDFQNWIGYAQRHPLNVQRVWRELEVRWINGERLDCPPLD